MSDENKKKLYEGVELIAGATNHEPISILDALVDYGAITDGIADEIFDMF